MDLIHSLIWIIHSTLYDLTETVYISSTADVLPWKIQQKGDMKLIVIGITHLRYLLEFVQLDLTCYTMLHDAVAAHTQKLKFDVRSVLIWLWAWLKLLQADWPQIHLDDRESSTWLDTQKEQKQSQMLQSGDCCCWVQIYAAKPDL